MSNALRIALSGSAAGMPIPQLLSNTSLIVGLGAALIEYFDPSVGVTVDGSNKVSAWTGRVSGAILAQATQASKPLLVSAGLGGFPHITFDGVDDELTIAAIPGTWPMGTTEGWLWLFLRNSTTDFSTVKSLFGYGASSPLSARRSIRFTTAGISQAFAGGSSPLARLSRNVVLGARFFAAGGSVSGRAYALDSPVVTGAGFSTTAGKVRLGAAVDNAPAGTYVGMDVAGVLVTGPLTAAQIALIESVGAWRIGYQF